MSTPRLPPIGQVGCFGIKLFWYQAIDSALTGQSLGPTKLYNRLPLVIRTLSAMADIKGMTTKCSRSMHLGIVDKSIMIVKTDQLN